MFWGDLCLSKSRVFVRLDVIKEATFTWLWQIQIELISRYLRMYLDLYIATYR